MCGLPCFIQGPAKSERQSAGPGSLQPRGSTSYFSRLSVNSRFRPKSRTFSIHLGKSQRRRPPHVGHEDLPA